MAADKTRTGVAEELGDSLASLLRARLLGPSALIEIAVSLSKTGYSRREIVDFFYRVAVKFQAELAEEDLDTLGDLNHHIAGDQCPIDQIVRLHDDPEDVLQLASVVSREMNGWLPPSPW